MKKQLINLLIIAGVLSITLIYSCKKKESTTANNGSTLDANSQTFNDDANYYKSENDQVNNDVNSDISTYHPGMRLPAGSDPERFQSYSPPCGSTVDTSLLISQHKLIYNFDGTTNCWGRHRSGSITVQLMPGTSHWSDSGAVLSFSTTNYTVTRIFDGKSITFSGTKTLKNVHGSNLAQWYAFYLGTGTIKLQERALGVNVTFSGGLNATWNSAATAEWSYIPNKTLYVYTADGDTSINGVNNICAWGENRFSQAFVTHLTAPIVCNSTCGYYEPMSGGWIHNVNNSTLTVTYGVNQNGTPYSGVGCPWGFNVSWLLNNGNNGSANFQY